MTRNSGMREPRMRGRLPLRARPRSTRCSVVLPLGSTRWHLSKPRRCRRRHPARLPFAMPMRAPEFWHQPPGLAAGLLAPAGAAWDLAARLRRAVARPYRAPVPVLCVGNLVAGGSGKTPVALSLARLFTERGIAVHVVTRGYRGEPVAAGLARAAAVVLIGDAPTPSELSGASCPVLRAAVEPVNGERFRNARLVAFAGIGRPEKFFAMLRRLGGQLVATHAFGDH